MSFNLLANQLKNNPACVNKRYSMRTTKELMVYKYYLYLSRSITPSLSSTVTFVSSSVLFLYDVGWLCLFSVWFCGGGLKLNGSERREK